MAIRIVSGVYTVTSKFLLKLEKILNTTQDRMMIAPKMHAKEAPSSNGTASQIAGAATGPTARRNEAAIPGRDPTRETITVGTETIP